MNHGVMDLLSIFMFVLFIILFFAGMTILRIGLFNISGDRMKKWLSKLTDSPLKGLILGIIVTAILQSSSAVMVITIGLIAAGQLTFKRSIGIILGTNIGTTVTVEFLAFSTDSFILPLVLIGSIFSLFKHSKYRSLGFSLFGLGTIFLAMEGFKKLTVPLSQLPLVKMALTEMNDHFLFAIILGTVVTSIIQSSSAATGIAMSFLQSDMIHLQSAISFMLGSNIGTCMTAILAAIGSGMEARLTSYAHVWLNIIGVLIFIPFISIFTEFIEVLTPDRAQQLAHSSVLFNVIVSFIFLPIAKPFSIFIERLHNSK